MQIKDVVLNELPLAFLPESIKVITKRTPWTLCIFNCVPVLNQPYWAYCQTGGWVVRPSEKHLSYDAWYCQDDELSIRMNKKAEKQ